MKRSRTICVVFITQIVIYSGILYFARWRLPYGTRLGLLTWTPAMADGIQMWSVGVAGLVAVLGVKRSLGDIGLRRADPRYIAIACVVPCAYCIAIYVPCWLAGLAWFKGGRLLVYAIASTLAHLPWHVAMASGEEVGWRGALTPNLSALVGPRRAALACGLVWASWHYGDILFFNYDVGTPWPFAICCFTISVTGMAIYLTWLRNASRSIWPCILFHGVHNSVIYGIFDRSTELDSKAGFLTTEFGSGLALSTTVLGIFGWRALSRQQSL